MENLLERSSADGSSTSSSGGRGSQLSFPYIDGDNNWNFSLSGLKLEKICNQGNPLLSIRTQ